MTRDDDAEDADRDDTGGFVDEWEDHEHGDAESVPESDPRHIDPAGDLADAVETGDLEVSLADDQDVDELREFVERADAGEFDPVDPGLEAQVRIARSLLDDVDDE